MDGAVVEPEQLRRATLASSVGSALEYYDFYIYGLASALIFGPLFFKPLGESGALIASFATYGVGFAARPFGGIFFGFIGDRFGRKVVLLMTIGMMALPASRSACFRRSTRRACSELSCW
ncbi:shikimate transporter [Arthrobacter sp. Hiyo8]|nr:shikimate transporter [Arthrobacter sp. Hiyo8]